MYNEKCQSNFMYVIAKLVMLWRAFTKKLKYSSNQTESSTKIFKNNWKYFYIILYNRKQGLTFLENSHNSWENINCSIFIFHGKTKLRNWIMSIFSFFPFSKKVSFTEIMYFFLPFYFFHFFSYNYPLIPDIFPVTSSNERNVF